MCNRGPFHEKSKFRGYMQGLLEESINSTIALIAIVLFFAYSHFWVCIKFGLSSLMFFASLTYILLPALVLGLEYTAYKNIIATITTHDLRCYTSMDSRNLLLSGSNGRNNLYNNTNSCIHHPSLH